jgi:hypothetical protein
MPLATSSWMKPKPRDAIRQNKTPTNVTSLQSRSQLRRILGFAGARFVPLGVPIPARMAAASLQPFFRHSHSLAKRQTSGKRHGYRRREIRRGCRTGESQGKDTVAPNIVVQFSVLADHRCAAALMSTCVTLIYLVPAAILCSKLLAHGSRTNTISSSDKINRSFVYLQNVKT